MPDVVRLSTLPGRGHVALVVAAALFFASPAIAQPPPHKILDAAGFQQNRDYFSQAPFENIDTLTGSLVLTFTDLVLPGNAGRELRFERTYNSKKGGWTFGIAGIALYLSEPPIPPVQPDTPQTGAPALHMSDGTVRQMAWYESPNVNNPASFNQSISSDFWRYDRSSRTLLIPNGTRCVYEENPADPPPTGLLRVDRCWDTFQNYLDLTWSVSPNPPDVVVTQKLSGASGADNRDVRLAFSTVLARFPESLTFLGRTWSYNIVANAVTSVTAPEAQTWQYSYNGLDLTSVTTPHGGTITYTYFDQQYEGPDPQAQYFTRVVKARTTGGTLPPGEWAYDYLITGNGLSGITTVTSPETVGPPRRRVRYTHGGYSGSELVVFDGVAGTVPVAEHVTQVEDGETWRDVERDVRSYQLVDVLGWTQYGTLEPHDRFITRIVGNQMFTYTTTFVYGTSNFGNYHHPREVIESGEAGTRRTIRSYKHLFGTNIYKLALPLTEVVEVGSERFRKAWTYNSANGFRTAETIYGISTTFVGDPFGNVHNVIRADGTWTSFTYEWGIVKTIATPAHTTTRMIKPEGLVGSETQAGRTTVFTYDNLFRVTSVAPPDNTTPVITTYDPAGGWVRVTRGSSEVTTDLDGLGRPIGTVKRTLNGPDVRTTTEYDAEGRVAYESYPYDAANIGTSTTYDALGRPVTRTNPDNSTSSMTYGIGTVTFEDEEGRTTTRTLAAFGDPNQARLMSVTDADNKTWQYTYDGIDQLRTVTAPGGMVRQWEYVTDAGTFGNSNRLFRETHPESGQVTYQYDATGHLQTKTDQRGTFTYTYDANKRLSTIAATGGPTTTFTYETGSDNRATATVGDVSSSFAYDDAGRLETRTDVIGAKTFVTDFLYDANDRLVAIEYPTPTGASRHYVEFQHDAADRVTRVFEGTQNYASSFQYHPSGAPSSFTSGNGVVNTFGYDQDRYWPTSITAGTWGLTYRNYDFVGNVGAIDDTRGTAYNQTFTYDVLDRLTGANGIYGTFAIDGYDAHGNRLATGYVYDTATLRLTQQPGTQFQYDNNGNLTNDGTTVLDYTPENMLKSVTVPNKVTTYDYDADLQRLRRVDDGIPTYFLRGLNGELLTEWRTVGETAQVRDYIYAGSRLVATIGRDLGEPPPPTTCPTTEILNHDYESGASLAALGYPTIIDVSNQNGEGLGGSTWGVRGNPGETPSGKYYAEFFAVVPHTGRAFKIEGQFDHADAGYSQYGYQAFEMMTFNGSYSYSGQDWFLSMTHGLGANRDLLDLWLGAEDENPVWTSEANTIIPGTPQTITMCGVLSTVTGSTVNPDGSVSIYVDGQLKVSLTNKRIGSAWSGDGNGRWRSLHVNTMGRFDNLKLFQQ